MYNKIYTCLDKNNIIYFFQFSFLQDHAASYTLVNLTETIIKALDDGKFACGIFVDFQKAFNVVDYSILLSKLCQYGIRGLANKCFELYLTDRKQFVSVNGFASSISSISCGFQKDLF